MTRRKVFFGLCRINRRLKGLVIPFTVFYEDNEMGVEASSGVCLDECVSAVGGILLFVLYHVRNDTREASFEELLRTTI